MEQLLKNGAFLVTNPLNQRYFHRLELAMGAVYVSTKRKAFLSWSLFEKPSLPKEILFFKIDREKLGTAVLELLAEDDAAFLIAEDDIPLNHYQQLREALGTDRLQTRHGIVEKLREQKNDWEVEQIQKACNITDRAFAAVLEKIRPGVTELEVAAELEKAMRVLGSETFNRTIVAAGVNSCKPHHWPTGYAIQTGDFVTMDYGCTVNGYHSDLTRTVLMGKADNYQHRIYQTVLDAQLESIEAVRAGRIGRDIDWIARSIIDRSEFRGRFLHGLGHGIGLSIHEGTGVGTNDIVPLESGMVVSIEPGIYLEGYGGVRIEDLLLVRETGCTVLEHADKNLYEL